MTQPPASQQPMTPESRFAVIKRRLVTIPRSVLTFLLMVALAPIVIPIAIAIDAFRWVATRKPAMTTRILAFGFVFFAVESVGLARLFLSWLRCGLGTNRRRLVDDAWPVQVWWARTLLAAVKGIFRIRIVVSGQEKAAPGPIIAMFRHASIVDNLLPAVLITADLGIKLRWIVKRELLAIPALDVAGRRLPNYFVDRQSEDPRGELRRIRALGEHLGAEDGVLIYPEGTRFTEGRRRRALERMRRSNDLLLPVAEQLRHVMPPRPGGTLALLDSGADVVLGVHQGLEGFAKLGDLWSGALMGRTVHVNLERVPATSIPRGRRDRVAWLYDRWADMDEWIELRTREQEPLP